MKFFLRAIQILFCFERFDTSVVAYFRPMHCGGLPACDLATEDLTVFQLLKK